MDLTNVTEDEKGKRILDLSCSAKFTEGMHGELIFLSALNIILSIAAFLGNTLILVALYKETSLHPPSKLLFRNLAITDLFVGIIVGPLAVTYWTSVVTKLWNICYYAYLSRTISGIILCSASMYTLTAICVDRLLALSLGLRYRQVVTLKRVCISLIVFWLLSIVSSLLFAGIEIISWLARVGFSLCLVTSTLSYIKIFFSLRHNEIHVHNQFSQGQPSQAPPMNIARYRKAVYSALWVQVTFVVCYLPFYIALRLTPQRGIPLSSIYLAREFTVTLVYLNSSLNPLLYCLKIGEVRQAVKETLQQLFCWSGQFTKHFKEIQQERVNLTICLVKNHVKTKFASSLKKKKKSDTVRCALYISLPV